MTSADPVFSLTPWRPVADAVYAATAEPDAVTIGLVVGSTGCLVVDTGSSTEQGRAIAASVAQVTDAEVVAVVATHAHQDHAGGLDAFPEVARYAHESLSAPVSRPIAVAAAVDLGGVRAEIAHLGFGHTGGDVVVCVSRGSARPHVVFAGDLVEAAPVEAGPWFGADSHPFDWPQTLDNVIGLLGPDTLVLPGHGEPMRRDDVFGQRGAIGAVADELERLLRAGVGVEQAAERGDWPFPVDHVAEAVPAAYADMTRRGLQPTPATPAPERALPIVSLPDE